MEKNINISMNTYVKSGKIAKSPKKETLFTSSYIFLRVYVTWYFRNGCKTNYHIHSK